MRLLNPYIFIFFFMLIISSFAIGSQELNENMNIIIFRKVTLVPMVNDDIVENQTVVVIGNKIREIGFSNQITIPKRAEVIDGDGAYLMPGLCDMHIHTAFNWNDGSDVWRTSPLNLYLFNGVTTIRCFGPEGGDQKSALEWRKKINKGLLTGPSIYACGPILFGPADNPGEIILDQAFAGFDFIKLYSYLTKTEFHEAVAAARHNGIYTAGHIPFPVGLKDALAEGMNEIAHIEELAWELFSFDRNKNLKGRKWISYVKEMVFKQYENVYSAFDDKKLEAFFENQMISLSQMVKSAKVPICTTLYLDEVINKKLRQPDKFLSLPENKYLPEKYIAAFKKGKEKHLVMFKGKADFTLFKQKLDLLLLRYLKQQDVCFVLGTDSGSGRMGMVPGYSIHDELRILTENGFSPYEAIKTGTVNASIVAENMNGSGNFGTIETGKKADMILVKENPLKDVGNIKKIIGVMASGRWYHKNRLEQLRNMN